MPKTRSKVLMQNKINIKRHDSSYENSCLSCLIVIYFSKSKFYEIPNKNFRRRLIKMLNKIKDDTNKILTESKGKYE